MAISPVSSSPIPLAVPRQAPAQPAEPQPAPTEPVEPVEPTEPTPPRGVTLSITPGENNVGPGEDRSGNTATITLTTPEREASVEVTRDQVVNSVEQAIARRTAREVFDPDPLLNPGPGLRLGLNPNAPDEVRETAVDALQLQASANLARTALDSASDARNGNSEDSNDNDDNQLVDLAGDALAAQRRQALFEASIERLDNAGERVDLLV